MNNESRLRTLAAHQSLMVVALQAVALWKNILKINLTLRITYLIYMGQPDESVRKEMARYRPRVPYF